MYNEKGGIVKKKTNWESLSDNPMTVPGQDDWERSSTARDVPNPEKDPSNR